MIFSWLKRRRRNRLLSTPFPAPWETHLDALPFYDTLNQEERARLRDVLRVIVHEKTWEGCGGLTMTEEIKVTTAAQAALLILNLEHDYYKRVKSIVVYPSTFMVPGLQAGGGGVVLEGNTAALGLAQHGGPVVLAWDSAKYGGENAEDGRNVILHEFAHKLDMLDHCADGTPPLGEREQYEAWNRIMTDEYEALSGKAKKGGRTLLDKYGATHPAEFFAVSTECFFEKPRQMQRKHAELYALLKSYYRQDPAERLR